MTLQLSKHLTNAIKRLGAENKMLALDLENSIKNKIKNQTENWKPLEASTKRAKSAGTKGKILFQNGTLVKSIKNKISNNKIFVGTNTVYARTHNEGDMSRNIRKREFLFLGKSEESIINIYAKKVIT